MEFQYKPPTVQQPNEGGTLSQDNLLPWQTSLSESGHKAMGNQINSIENISKNNEGVSSGSAVANQLFAQNTGSISKALNARASRQFATKQSQNQIGMGLKNVGRQQFEVKRALGNAANLERLKKINYEGQLRFADQIADYNRDLEASKFATLGSIMSYAGAGAGMGTAIMQEKKRDRERQEDRESRDTYTNYNSQSRGVLS